MPHLQLRPPRHAGSLPECGTSSRRRRRHVPRQTRWADCGSSRTAARRRMGTWFPLDEHLKQPMSYSPPPRPTSAAPCRSTWPASIRRHRGALLCGIAAAGDRQCCHGDRSIRAVADGGAHPRPWLAGQHCWRCVWRLRRCSAARSVWRGGAADRRFAASGSLVFLADLAEQVQRAERGGSAKPDRSSPTRRRAGAGGGGRSFRAGRCGSAGGFFGGG